MLAGIFMTLFLAKEPQIAQVDCDQPFYMVFWIPLKEFFQRKGVAQAIGFLLFCSCINLVIHLPLRYKRNSSMTWVLKRAYCVGGKSTSLWASISAGLVGA